MTLRVVRGQRAVVREAAGDQAAQRLAAALRGRLGDGAAGLCRGRLVDPGCGRRAAGAALRAASARDVADLCAAPGGKTAQLASAGARVTAIDRSTRRLHRLAMNLNRLGLPVLAIAADALSWRPPQPVDAVLLDAPCTATGAIRRHPDVPHLKQPEDVSAAVGGSGQSAARRARDPAARRHSGLLHLLARTGGGTGAGRGAAGFGRGGGAATDAPDGSGLPTGSPKTATCARCLATSPNMTESTVSTRRGW